MNLSVAQEHARHISRIRTLADVISPEDVAHAFVASLSTRRLASRSALGSYAVARVLPEHPLAAQPGAYATICEVCGWTRMPDGEEPDEAPLGRERERYGGVRHSDPAYIEFDLSRFAELPAMEPSAADWKALELILRTPALLAPGAKAADLERALKTALPSNKSERSVLIQILGYAGVLEAPGHPSYFDTFVPGPARDLPRRRFADWGYPIIWWRAGHGVRGDAAAFWFPELLASRAG